MVKSFLELDKTKVQSSPALIAIVISVKIVNKKVTEKISASDLFAEKISLISVGFNIFQATINNVAAKALSGIHFAKGASKHMNRSKKSA